MATQEQGTPSGAPSSAKYGVDSPNYPIQFLSLIRTNGGKHAQTTAANLWRQMEGPVRASGVKVSKPLAMFTGDVQLAIMGEAKSPADIARFAFVCHQEGLDVQTDLGYQPEIIEQQVRELATAAR